jgi:hypothetical protein
LSTTEPEVDEEPIPLHWTHTPPVVLSEFTRIPPDAGMNPVRRWLVNVLKECGSPEEVERIAQTVHTKNTKQMLLRAAARWKVAAQAQVIDP